MARYTKKKSTDPEADTAKDKDKDFVRKALAKYQRAYDKEQTNILAAYEDLEFRTGEQWPTEVKRQREADYRPCLTINKIPAFVQQITGDIRSMRPSIKVVPVAGSDENYLRTSETPRDWISLGVPFVKHLDGKLRER